MINCHPLFYLALTLFVCAVCMICVMDSYQQREFESVRLGYVAMENGDYVNSAEKFNDYLVSHKTELYWSLVEKVNGTESPYTRTNVEEALRISNANVKE